MSGSTVSIVSSVGFFLYCLPRKESGVLSWIDSSSYILSFNSPYWDYHFFNVLYPLSHWGEIICCALYSCHDNAFRRHLPDVISSYTLILLHLTHMWIHIMVMAESGRTHTHLHSFAKCNNFPSQLNL